MAGVAVLQLSLDRHVVHRDHVRLRVESPNANRVESFSLEVKPQFEDCF